MHALGRPPSPLQDGGSRLPDSGAGCAGASSHGAALVLNISCSWRGRHPAAGMCVWQLPYAVLVSQLSTENCGRHSSTLRLLRLLSAAPPHGPPPHGPHARQATKVRCAPCASPGGPLVARGCGAPPCHAVVRGGARTHRNATRRGRLRARAPPSRAACSTGAVPGSQPRRARLCSEGQRRYSRGRPHRRDRSCRVRDGGVSGRLSAAAPLRGAASVLGAAQRPPRPAGGGGFARSHAVWARARSLARRPGRDGCRERCRASLCAAAALREGGGRAIARAASRG
jgi:hypothetical protein